MLLCPCDCILLFEDIYFFIRNNKCIKYKGTQKKDEESSQKYNRLVDATLFFIECILW